MNEVKTVEDRQIHPWPGLAAYGPEDAASFFGREEEVRTLAQLIVESVQVTVFGPSGTGKTSMLRAGVLPQLAERDFLAVYIRLDHSPSAPAYALQIRHALDAQLQASGVEVDPTAEPTQPDLPESLWEYLHRCEFWSARNRLVRPVLVFDQFEEVFTLGQATENAQDLIAQLGDLCSNTVPRHLEAFLAQGGRRIGYPIDTQNYRLVLCLREDFLARLEEIAVNVPALRRNRFGIRAMSGLQAMQAVLGPGRDVLDDSVARQIVATVGNSHRTDGQPLSDAELGRLSVEPALLSLFCRELNNRRLAKGAARITLEHVRVSSSDILESFYADAMAKVAPATRAFVEDRLLTSSGFRSAVAVEDLGALGIPVDQIQSLVDQRILRFDERQGVRWVEFTHDILTGVARESRRRRSQEQRETTIRKQARQRTRQAVLIAVGATLIVAAVLGGWWMDYHRNRQEIVRYYNEWVKRNGLVEGIGELTDEQVRHRSVSFKLIRYGSVHPVTKMVAVDSGGDPTTRHNVGSYLSEKDDTASSARECQWEFILDSSGRSPVYEKAIDRFGRLVWGLVYSPVRNGNKVRASFVGRDGFPQSQAQNGSLAEYVEIEYSPEGFERMRTYMDRRGHPMPGPDRAFGQLREFNEKGQETYLASLGAPDAAGNRPKIVDDKGNCAEKIEYDAMGNVVAFTALDAAGTPTYLIEGNSQSRYEYDNYGRVISMRYLDTNGQPRINRDGVAGYSLEYDDRGDQVLTRCLGTDGKPCSRAEGHSAVAQQYDQKGNPTQSTFLGIDGQPCAPTNGIAISRLTYDGRGDVVERAFFDVHDRPAIDQATGSHKLVQKYDEQGKLIETRFFGVDGQPCLQVNGAAITRSKYDERGNELEWAYFDAQDRPTVDKSMGCQRIARVYDERGKITDERYYGTDGQLCLQSAGYAILRNKYDDRGNVIEMAYFDAQGGPALDKSTGVHKTIQTYDDRGYVAEAGYFGVDDQPCPQTAGYAIARVKYDERGNQVDWACFDTKDQPTVETPLGDHAAHSVYNAQGKVVETRYFGVDDRPCPINDGYSIVRMKYDASGNRSEFACFDINDRPTLNTALNAHKSLSKYNGQRKLIEERYFDPDGNPCALNKGYAIIRTKYDERGNQIEGAVFDAQDRPTVELPSRDHIERDTYNEQNKLIEARYFGVDDQLCTITNGYSIIRFKYDERGNVVESAYFDAQEKPVVDKGLGAHRVTKKSDERGNQTEERYFGADDRPCALSNSAAIVRMKYDQRGNRTEWACFDTQDRPTVEIPVGEHKSTSLFDEHGLEVETRYFGVDGRPCLVNRGFSIIRMKFNEHGTQIGSAFFDTQDRPIRTRLVITEILPGRVAERVGLKVGDVMWQYQGSDVFEIVEILRREKSPGIAPRTLLIHRNGQPITFVVPPGLLGARLEVRSEAVAEPPGMAQSDPATKPSESNK